MQSHSHCAASAGAPTASETDAESGRGGKIWGWGRGNTTFRVGGSRNPRVGGQMIFGRCADGVDGRYEDGI